MDSEIEWLESAQKELEAEIDYVVNEFGVRVAQKVYFKILKHINNLASFPFIGKKYEGVTYIGYEIRQLPIHQLTIFYSPHNGKITIIAIWNNYQNPDNLLERLQ